MSTSVSSIVGPDPVEILLSHSADLSDAVANGAEAADDGKTLLATVSDVAADKVVGVANSSLKNLVPIPAVQAVVTVLEKIDGAVPRKIVIPDDKLPSEDASLLAQVNEALDFDGISVSTGPSEHSRERVIMSQHLVQFFRDVAYVGARPAEALLEGAPTTFVASNLADAIDMVPPETQKKLGLDTLAASLRTDVRGDPKVLVSTAVRGAASVTGNAACLNPVVNDFVQRVAAASNGDSKPLASWCLQNLENFDELANGDDRLLETSLVDAFKRYSDKRESDRLKFAGPPAGQKYKEALVNSHSQGQSASQDVALLTDIPIPELVSPATSAKESEKVTKKQGSGPHSKTIPVVKDKGQKGSPVPIDKDKGQKGAAASKSPKTVSEETKKFCADNRAILETLEDEKAATISALVEKPPALPSANLGTLSISPALLSQARQFAQQCNFYQLYGMTQEQFNENLKWDRRQLVTLESDVSTVDPDILVGVQKDKVEKAASDLHAAREEHGRTGRNALNVDKANVHFIAELEFYDRLVVKAASFHPDVGPATGRIYKQWLDAKTAHEDAEKRAGKYDDPHRVTNKIGKAVKGVVSELGFGSDPKAIVKDERFKATVFGLQAERHENRIDSASTSKTYVSNPENVLGWSYEHIKGSIAQRKTEILKDRGASGSADLDTQIAQQSQVVDKIAAAYQAADAVAVDLPSKTRRNELLCQYIAEVDFLGGLELKKGEVASSVTPASSVPDAEDPSARVHEKETKSLPASEQKKDSHDDKGSPAPEKADDVDKKKPSSPSKPKKDSHDHDKDSSAPKKKAGADQKKPSSPSKPKEDSPDVHEEESPVPQHTGEVDQKEGAQAAKGLQKEDISKDQDPLSTLAKIPDIRVEGSSTGIPSLSSLGVATEPSAAYSSIRTFSSPTPNLFFDSSSGLMNMHTPFQPREARMLNAESRVSELFGRGAVFPGKFECQGAGKVTFKFDNPQESSFNPQRLREFSRDLASQRASQGAASRPLPVAAAAAAASSDPSAADHAYESFLHMPRGESHPPMFVQKTLCYAFAKAQNAVIGAHDLVCNKQFDHDEKVRTHLRKLEEIEKQLPRINGPFQGSPLWVLAHRTLAGPAREALQSNPHILSDRSEATKRILEIYHREHELHERGEQQTEKYRVIVRNVQRVGYRGDIEPDRTFTPEFLDEIEPYFITVERCEGARLKELKDDESKIKERFINPEIRPLIGTLPVRLQASVVHHSLYAKGILELTSGKYSLAPDSEAFKTLSRLYMHEFVDTIQNGMLKEDFLRSENGRQFRETLWKAYTDLVEKEALVVAAQQEHSQLGCGWRAIDWMRGTPNVAKKMDDLKSSVEIVVKHMKQLHLNIIAQELEKTPEGDPLVEAKKSLLALLKGEKVDEQRSFIGTVLLPALGRSPLYSPPQAGAGELPDERRWLRIGVPQTLFFGACENPESLAAKLIAFERR